MNYKIKKMLLLFAMTIIVTLLFSCKSRVNKEEISSTKTERIILDTVNVILENSGSMAGYLNGNNFRKNVTDFIAELDKWQSDTNIVLGIEKINFLTFSNKMRLNKFSGTALEFSSKINNKNIAYQSTSPMDSFVQLLVDSAKTDIINILISDFVIDIKGPNLMPTLQSKFNIIFNKAKQKDLGLLIYRFTSDFQGNYIPSLGKSIYVKNIERPYFIWIIGNMKKLNALRIMLSMSNLFEPINEISFGIPLVPLDANVLNLSNRNGKWRFKNGEFVKMGLIEERLKFTIALNMLNMPKYLQDIETLKNSTEIVSTALNIESFHYYDIIGFNSLIHKKERNILNNNTHFLEVNISDINSLKGNVVIRLRYKLPEWIFNYSTDNDSKLDNGNNLKTFALNSIINGIANAYGVLEPGYNYFELKYTINE